MRRSLLYTPGNNERMLRKAPTLGADVLIVDLEDAVPLEFKGEARALIGKLFGDSEYAGSLKNVREACVRINPLSSPEGLKDLSLIAELESVDCIVVPKAEGEISFLYKATGKKLIAIVETAKGLLRAEDIAASEGVEALALGTADLALSLGGSSGAYENNQYIRTFIVAVARAYGLDPIDKVYFKVDDIEGFKREALEAKALGYAGKQVIHPSQVEVANRIFSPSEEEIERAKEIVKIYEEALKSGQGALRYKGELVDHVHYRLAKRILETANIKREQRC